MGRWAKCLDAHIYERLEWIRISRERQEYPNKRFDEAIDEKLAVASQMRAVC